MSSFRLGSAGWALAVPALSLAGALAITRSPQLGGALVALGLLGLVGALGTRAPWTLVAVVLASLVFVPIYTSPTLKPLLLEPTAVLCWVLVLASATWVKHGHSLRLPALDRATALFFALLVLSVASRARTFSQLVFTLFLWLGPYLAGRAICGRLGARLFATGVASAGLALTPFAIYEAVTGNNIFTGFVVDHSLASLWTQSSSRFGQTRVAASFGHPLALSMFLSVACVCSFGLGLERTSRRRARWWVAGGCALLVAQALSLSRTGWVVLAVAAIPLVLRKGRNFNLWAVALSVVVLAGVFMLPQTRPAREVLSSLVSAPRTSNLAANQQYRLDLLHRATGSGALSPFGSRENRIAGSVDNEYLYLADQWGLVPLAAFVLMALLSGWAAIRYRGGPAALAVASACFGAMAGLVFVAFITQQQIFVWLLLGAASAVVARGGRLRHEAGS